METSQKSSVKGRYRMNGKSIILIRILGIPFAIGYVIWEAIDDWCCRQEQKIEDARIDKIYLEKYGKTYKEYYSE